MKVNALQREVEEDMKINRHLVADYLIIATFIISGLSLIAVYTKSYIAEAHMAHALPLSLVIGFTAIALAINNKKRPSN